MGKYTARNTTTTTLYVIDALPMDRGGAPVLSTSAETGHNAVVNCVYLIKRE